MRARFGVIRAFARPARGGPLLLLALLVGVFVASAQAATSTKFYSVTITPDALEVGVAQELTVRVTNSTSSTQSLGSANVEVPASFAVTPTPATCPATVSNPSKAWKMCYVAPNLEFRAASSKSALGPGEWVEAKITVTPSAVSPTVGDFLWKTRAKQSNNFSGAPGNDFLLDPNVRGGTDPVVSVFNELCNNPNALCSLSDGTTTVETAGPTSGTIGLALLADTTFDCVGVGEDVPVLGSIVRIAPSSATEPYTVTLLYSQTESQGINHNTWPVCISKDGITYTLMPECTPTSTSACVFDRGRTTAGQLEIIIQLQPGDPFGGGPS